MLSRFKYSSQVFALWREPGDCEIIMRMNSSFRSVFSLFSSHARRMSTHISRTGFCQRARSFAPALFAAITLAASLPVEAQTTASIATKQNGKTSGATQNARLFDPASISLRVLPNGVRGIVRETRGTGLVAVQVWVRAGSRFEVASNAGASHLIETLAMQDSRDYPRGRNGSPTAGGAAGAIAALGGVASSQTSRDAANYGATVAASFAPAAVRILADAVLRPSLADADVEGAKVEIEADLQRRSIDPVASAADLAYSAAFAKHPYRRAANGTTEAVDALGGARVRAYHTARYVSRNISVVIVGDVRAATAHALIAQAFAGAPVATSKDVKIEPEKTPLAFKNISRRGLISRGSVALGFRAPGIDTPKDVIAMDVLLSRWSEGRDAALRRVLLGDAAEDKDDSTARKNFTQPLNPDGTDAPTNPAPDAVVPDSVPAPDATSPDAAPNSVPQDAPAPPTVPEPLALGFDVGFLTQRDPSLLIVSLVVDPATRAQAIRATLDEIANVRANGLTASDLANAKKLLKRQYIQQSESVSGQAGALGFYDMISTYEFAVTYLDRIDRVSASDIKRVATTYLSGSNYVQVVIEPASRPRVQPRPDDGSITA